MLGVPKEVVSSDWGRLPLNVRHVARSDYCLPLGTPALLLMTSQDVIYRPRLSPAEPSEAGPVAGQGCLCWGGGWGQGGGHGKLSAVSLERRGGRQAFSDGSCWNVLLR